MAHPAGNQVPFAFGAADNSTNNNLAGDFYPAGNDNMRLTGAYGNTTFRVPHYGGASHAPFQQVPMGFNGRYQSMPAGMPTGQYMRQPVAYYPAAQGISMANGPSYGPMAYGMRPSMSNGPVPAVAPLSGLQANHAAIFEMRRSHSTQGLPEQRPALMVAAARMGNGDASIALPFPAGMNAAPVRKAQAAPPAELIDLTNDDDEPTAAPSTPVTQRASKKRAIADSTSKSPSKPVKKARYSRFQGNPFPSPPFSSPAIYTPADPSSSVASSSASPSTARVLPATPSPVQPPPAPRKKRPDPHNLLGSIHYTYMEKPANPFSGPPDQEKTVRPIWDSKAEPERRRRSEKAKKSKKTSKAAEESVNSGVDGSSSSPAPLPETNEATVSDADADSEADAEFELDDENVAPAAPAPAAVDDAAVFDPEDQLVVVNGVVVNGDDGMPIKPSVWSAQQAYKNRPLEFDDVLQGEHNAIDPAELFKSLNTSAPDCPEVTKKLAAAAEKADAARKKSASRTKKSSSAAKEKAVAPKKRSAAPKKPSKKSAATKKSRKERTPTPVSDQDDENAGELAAALAKEMAASATHDEDLEIVQDLEDRFSDITTERDLDEKIQAYIQACSVVGWREGPLEDRLDELRLRWRNRDEEDLEVSEDES